MTPHALINGNDEILAIQLQDPIKLPATKPGFTWLAVDYQADEEFDPATQKLTEQRTVTGNSVIIQKVATALSTQELAQLNYYNAVVAGYTVQPEGFTLKIEDQDRIAFSQLLGLVREALELGLITDANEQVITDINGQPHTVTVLRFRQIMVGLGLYYKDVWNALVSAGL